MIDWVVCPLPFAVAEEDDNSVNEWYPEGYTVEKLGQINQKKYDVTYSTATFAVTVTPIFKPASFFDMVMMPATKPTVHTIVLKALMMMNTIGFSLLRASKPISVMVKRRQTQDNAIQTGKILR
jgi:hypothetical protein